MSLVGKRFAEDFLRIGLVKAGDKVLIQDSEDGQVKYALMSQLDAINGYRWVDSIENLPTNPEDKNIGYVVGGTLYLFVGSGGDTRDGLYQSIVFVGSGAAGGIDEDQLEQYLEANKYITEDWINEQGFIKEKDLLNDVVTIADAQDVTGVKNFVNGFKINGNTVKYDATTNTWLVEGNLLVTGGVSFYTTLGDVGQVSVFDGLPIDGTTIVWKTLADGSSVLSAIGGGSGGGITAEDVETILNGKGYATQTWVNNKRFFLQDSFTKANIQNTLGISSWALTSSKPSYTYSEITGTPSSLKNPYAITFSGYDTGTYDGSKALSIEIPEELPNPYSLSWSGYSSGSYDGSSSKSISIPYKLSQLTDDILSGYYLPIDGIADRAKILAGSKTDSSYIVAAGNGFNVMQNSDVGRFWFGFATPAGADITKRWIFGTGGGVVTQELGEIHAKSIMLGDTSGNFYSPSYTLHVKGNIYTTGAVTMANTSDVRLKKNIRAFKAGETLKSLGGVYAYEYIDKEVERDSQYAGTHFGFLYQNVKGTELDVMCIEREDGYGTLNILSAKFIGLLAAVGDEHETRLSRLEKQIAILTETR